MGWDGKGRGEREGGTYVGRTSRKFLGVNLRIDKGGTTPLALPILTIVPFLLATTKLSSNLQPFRVRKRVEHQTEGADVRILPNSIEYPMNTLPTCQFFDALDDALVGVINNMFRPVRFCNRRFFGCGSRSYNMCSNPRRDLCTKSQSNANAINKIFMHTCVK